MVVARNAVVQKSYYAEILKKTRRRLRQLLFIRVAYITESAALANSHDMSAANYERCIQRTELSIAAARVAITIQVSMCVLSTLSKRFCKIVRGMR